MHDSERRDSVGKVKSVRDGLRTRTRKIKETSVFITNPVLLQDIQVSKHAHASSGMWVELAYACVRVCASPFSSDFQM
jgi:hypothetical protein